MSKLTDSVKEAIVPTLEGFNIELVDIEFDKKYGEDNLTIFIDSALGITLDECEKVHLAIDPIIDNLDPTNGLPYVLNVSSPGLDRPFKSQRDFERNYGKEVEIKLYAPLKGKKLFEGILISHDQNTTTILVAKASLKFNAKKGVLRQSVMKAIKAEEETNISLTEEIKIENTRIAYTRPLVKFE